MRVSTRLKSTTGVPRAVQRAWKDATGIASGTAARCRRRSSAYAWHVPLPRLDVAAMSEAAAMLEGAHDFAAFQSVGTNVPTTERSDCLVGGTPIAGSEARDRCRPRCDGRRARRVRSARRRLPSPHGAIDRRDARRDRSRSSAGRVDEGRPAVERPDRRPDDGAGRRLFLVAVTYEPAARTVADRMVNRGLSRRIERHVA